MQVLVGQPLAPKTVNKVMMKRQERNPKPNAGKVKMKRVADPPSGPDVRLWSE